MRVFHGSPRSFTKLRIDKRLIRHNATLENEGAGIYFTTDPNRAKSYGRYLYELEISDKYLMDFRNIKECAKYLTEVRKHIISKAGVDIGKYIDLRSIAASMHNTHISISETCNEIYLLLDSNEQWYSLSNSRIQRIYSILRAFDRRNLKVYMFPYMIENVGISKTTDESIIRIVSKYEQ